MSAFAPNTQGILDEIKNLLSTLLLSDGITAAYQTVIIGGVKDFTDTALPCATIVLHGDDSTRHASGGAIVEHQEVELRSIVDYSVAATAETQVVAIRDALMPTLQKYATLQSTPGVYNAKIKPNSAQFGWVWLKPNWYRAHKVDLLVAQYYLIQGGIQS